MRIHAEDKLLLTEFNHIVPKKKIVSFSIVMNRQKTYSVIAEMGSGEFVTIAVTSLQIAKRLIRKLTIWMESNSDFPFHTQYEVRRIACN